MISVYAMLFFASFGIGCWCWYHFTHSWHFGDDWSHVPPKEEPPVTQRWGESWRASVPWGETHFMPGRIKTLGDDSPSNAFVFRSNTQRDRYLDALKHMDENYGQEIEDAIRRAEEKKRLHDEGKDNLPPPRPDPSIGRIYR